MTILVERPLSVDGDAKSISSDSAAADWQHQAHKTQNGTYDRIAYAGSMPPFKSKPDEQRADIKFTLSDTPKLLSLVQSTPEQNTYQKQLDAINDAISEENAIAILSGIFDKNELFDREKFIQEFLKLDQNPQEKRVESYFLKRSLDVLTNDQKYSQDLVFATKEIRKKMSPKLVKIVDDFMKTHSCAAGVEDYIIKDVNKLDQDVAKITHDDVDIQKFIFALYGQASLNQWYAKGYTDKNTDPQTAKQIEQRCRHPKVDQPHDKKAYPSQKRHNLKTQ